MPGRREVVLDDEWEQDESPGHVRPVLALPHMYLPMEPVLVILEVHGQHMITS